MILRPCALVLAAAAALPAADFLEAYGGEQTVAAGITIPGRSAPAAGIASGRSNVNAAWAYWSIAGLGRWERIGRARPNQALRLAGAPPTYLTADFNGDGCEDMLIINRDSGQNALVLGSSDGTLLNGGSPLPAKYTDKVIDGDIGNFNDAERAWLRMFVVGDNEPISVMPNSGSLTKAKVGAWQVRTGDFNGDGKADLIAQSTYSDWLEILFSKVEASGTVSFAAPISVARPDAVGNWGGYNGNTTKTSEATGTEVEVADFDNDGKSDLMVRMNLDDSFNGSDKKFGLDKGCVFMLSRGNGTFSEFQMRFVDRNYTPVESNQHEQQWRFNSRNDVRIADANGDGLPDLFGWRCAKSSDEGASLFINMGKRSTGDAALLFASATNARNQTWHDTGHGYVENTPTENATDNENELHWELANVLFADFDADNQMDILFNEKGGWANRNGSDSGIMFQQGGGAIFSMQSREVAKLIGCPSNGAGDSTSSTAGGVDGSIVQAADFNGDGKADLMSLSLNPSSGYQVTLLTPGRPRGTLSTQGTIQLPAGRIHQLIAADIDGDGRKEMIAVRSASGLPMQVYRSGAWYQETLYKTDAGIEHNSGGSVESLVINGKAVLFKRHAEAGKGDGKLAWTTAADDGTWLPWAMVPTADKNGIDLGDRPFTVTDDGIRIIVTQRTKLDEFVSRRFVYRSGKEPSLTPYQQVVFAGSGTTTPLNDDDTLITKIEGSYTWTLASFFKSGDEGTPSGQLQNDDIGKMLAGQELSNNSLFDLALVPGAGGQRLVVTVPRKNGGLLVVSLRTEDGRPAPRGKAAPAAQTYIRPGQINDVDGTVKQPILPDGVASYIYFPNELSREFERPSLAAVWNYGKVMNNGVAQVNESGQEIEKRRDLALKVAFTVAYDQTVPKSGGLFVYHVPLDEYGAPVAVCKKDGTWVEATIKNYADTTCGSVPWFASRTLPGIPGSPLIYQGVDGYAHVLVPGNFESAGTNMLELLIDTLAPTTEQVRADRKQECWAASGYKPALIPHHGWVDSAAVRVSPRQVRGLPRPAVIEYPIVQKAPSGKPQAWMWRSIVCGEGRVYASLPRRLVRLDTQTLGYALVSPKIVGVIESAPPLPPEILGSDEGNQSSVTLQEMASADYQISTSSKNAFRASMEMSVMGLAVEGGFGAGSNKGRSWGVTTSSIGATTLGSTVYDIAGSENKPMRQLGQVIFTGDKAEIQALTIPGTGRSAGVFLTPVPGQTITRVYPFGLKTSYLDLSQWGASAAGHVTASERVREERDWTNDLKAVRMRTLTMSDSSSGYNQGRNESDAEMQRRIDLGGLRNTYQWTAYGGFRAATEERSNRSVYDYTGFGDLSIMVGIATEKGSAAGVGYLYTEKLFSLKALAGYQGEWSDTKTETGGSGRGMVVDLTINRNKYLRSILAKAKQATAAESNGTAAGLIDAIEFTTFFLPKSSQNYSDFYGKALSPSWLVNPQAASAQPPAIIRDAQINLREGFGSQREIWRIAHRVTMISRLYNAQASGTAELR